MSMPSAVFLDTQVLAAQNYNFSSTTLATFVPACKKHSMKLLLPDPTEREVRRHLDERARSVIDAFDTVRREAQFLSGWKSFPQPSSIARLEVRRVAEEAWGQFLRQFDVVKLGYTGLDITKIMTWYDSALAPFREGKKRKEFPDAFAIALLEAYATANDCYVAVVSGDPDFKLACDRFPSLLHFRALPRLTELLLTDDDKVTQLREALERDLSDLTAAIDEELQAAEFSHTDKRLKLLKTSVSEAHVNDVSVVAIGDGECTITFDVYFEGEHEVRWDRWIGPDEEWPETSSAWVTEEHKTGGTAKIGFEAATTTLSGIRYVALDYLDFEVDRTPRESW